MLSQYTLVIIISSGGESPNMINCLNWCEDNKIDYGVLTGFDNSNKIRTVAKKRTFGTIILIVVVMVWLSVYTKYFYMEWYEVLF